MFNPKGEYFEFPQQIVAKDVKIPKQIPAKVIGL